MKDQELVSKIKGLSFINKINPRPFVPYFNFEVHKNTRTQNFIEFLNSLPEELEFIYFKCLGVWDNSESQMVVVQKAKDGYLYHYASHRKDSTWKWLSESELLEELLTHRSCQLSNAIRIRRKSNEAVLGQRAINN